MSRQRNVSMWTRAERCMLEHGGVLPMKQVLYRENSQPDTVGLGSCSCVLFNKTVIYSPLIQSQLHTGSCPLYVHRTLVPGDLPTAATWRCPVRCSSSSSSSKRVSLDLTDLALSVPSNASSSHRMTLISPKHMQWSRSINVLDFLILRCATPGVYWHFDFEQQRRPSRSTGQMLSVRLTL